MKVSDEQTNMVDIYINTTRSAFVILQYMYIMNVFLVFKLRLVTNQQKYKQRKCSQTP